MSTYSDASLILPVAPYIKDGKIYSLKPTDGTGDFYFSRASNATIINKDGLIETVGSNIPRLSYPMIDGVVSGCPSLLLEPSRSNLIVNSERISLSPIKKGTFVDNFAISPDGKQNATKLTATNTDPYFYQNLSFSAASYTASIYVKGIGNSIGKSFQIRLANNFYTYVIPSEWTRFECTATLTSGTANAGLEIPNPAVVGDEVLVWGWQVEQGSYATSYIPTNGAIATRLQDDCSIADLLTNGILTSNNFSFIFDFTLDYQNAKDNAGGFVRLRDSSNNLLFRIYINDLITGRTYFRNESPVDEVYMIVASNQKKIGISVTNGIVSYFVNGIKGGTMTSTLSDVEKLYLYTPAMVDGGSFFAAQILAFNRGLTDAEMITKTTL